MGESQRRTALLVAGYQRLPGTSSGYQDLPNGYRRFAEHWPV